MNIEKLFLKRQSTREFSDKPVSDGEIENICRLARLAPSAINGQPYKLYGINGKKAKEFTKNIQKNGANRWADSAAAYIVIEELEPIEIHRGERVISNAPFIENDIGILAAYLALAAEDCGVQSCIVGLRDEKAIAEFLNLPQNTRFPLIIALGHAADGYPVREKQRRDFNEVYKLIK
ncbi:MAG: nitroreductase family protein [Clostridia bacterium]|nr:nitroreductase family protein [Clostridia bacterium]